MPKSRTHHAQRRRHKNRAAGSSRKTNPVQNLDLTTIRQGRVAHLADRGDGLVVVDNEPTARFFVPGVLPGEVIAFASPKTAPPQPTSGRLDHLVTPSPNRVDAPCDHALDCGGCQLQHADLATIQDFKAARVQRLLNQQGLPDIKVLDTITAWGDDATTGSRRRMEYAIRRAGNQITLGLHQANSRNLLDVKQCPVAVPAIENALPGLRDFAALALTPGEQADCHVTATDHGLDIVLTRKRPPSLDERLDWPGFCEAQGWPRLSWRASHRDAAETITAFVTPTITIAGQPVPLAPAGFIQATATGQEQLISLVLEHLHDAPRTQRCLDLFSGMGTFTLPLLADDPNRTVKAIDTASDSLDNLRLGGVDYGSRLTIEARDLFRHPLSGPDLADIDCAIFDPPRAGAEAQVKELADSSLAYLIAVSCNPNSFARDARILIDHGFTMSPVQPVDQFQWSVETELVAAFTR